MANTLLVCGYGPGVSTAVAERFGREGFAVALVARDAKRLDAGVAALAAKNIKAVAFPTDLADTSAAAALPRRVREALGPVSVIHWNAYAGAAGDLLAAGAPEIHAALDIAVTNLLATVSAALPDLKAADKPAVLVTNGAFGKIAAPLDAVAVKLKSMGLAIANAAKDKLVGILSARLAGDGVYVGQVMIAGTIKGSAWDQGNANLDASAVAERFWSLYTARRDIRAEIG